MSQNPDANGHVRKNFLVRGGPTKDGRLVVEVQWPDEQDGRVFDRDEAVMVSVWMLNVASKLFSSAEEFGQVVNFALSRLAHVEPITFRPPDLPVNRAEL
jgi:hypothetical protein